jgi:lon-related putative ATP-dependent protease
MDQEKLNGPKSPAPLTADQAARRCKPAELGFETTAKAEPLVGIVGQDRALRALEFGARMDGDGFNLYVLGTPGSQRHDVVWNFLQEESRDKEQPNDWCYVYNFDDAHKPRGITLPAGWGKRFQQDMSQLLEDLRASVPAAFESENYRNRLAEIEQEFHDRNKEALESFQAEAAQEGLELLPTPHGFAIAPVRDGQVLEEDEFRKLPKEERKRTQEAISHLTERLKKQFQNMPIWHKERRGCIKELERKVTMLAVGSLISELKERYADHPPVLQYLDAVQQNVIDNAQDFLTMETAAPSPLLGMRVDPETLFQSYAVNVLINNEATEGAPVVYENNPTYQNLVGRIEHTSQFGTMVTDFTMVRPGALHSASGGYLMLDAEKVLLQPFAWEALKRAIKDRQVRIESIAQMLSLISAQSLEPDAMPLDVKIVLIGDRLLYYLLCEFDPEFPQLFKVAADFEDRVPRTATNVKLYGRMLSTIIQEHELHDFTAQAVARVIDESSRHADDTEKLSAHLRSITDLLSEANYWARDRSAELVDVQDVQRAVDERTHRQDRLRAQMQEAILRKTIHVSTDGGEVGQVNGLSVLPLGDFAFGQPSRITATARVGEGEVVDIEREVELGGAIHSKGVLILSSYLGACYARDRPLSLAASLVFEQSYGGVEGDSASVAELVALLSAIGDVPIKQSLAVTGSIDQRGKVQAIGGVNQKIEGFFDICDSRGLTGNQGVLIPSDNVQHLMLRGNVVNAIKEDSFRVYPVTAVDEAIALLTGLPAGARSSEGEFPDGSVNRSVEDALRELAEQRRLFAVKGEAAGTEADEE